MKFSADSEDLGRNARLRESVAPLVDTGESSTSRLFFVFSVRRPRGKRTEKFLREDAQPGPVAPPGDSALREEPVHADVDRVEASAPHLASQRRYGHPGAAAPRRAARADA